MNKKQSQSGSIHLAVTILLAIALIGTLGFVYYQNFIQTKDNVSKADNVKADNISPKTDGIKGTDNTKPTAPVTAPATVVNGFLTSYFSYMKSSALDHSEIPFASQSTALTDAYKDRITNPSGTVNVSPIILAQNISDSFTVGTATTTSSNSTVPVTLSFEPPYNLVYSLVIVGNEWKIDGVTRG